MRTRTIPKLTRQRAERLTHGLTLVEVATAAGIPPSLLSEFERGRAVLSDDEDAARRRAIATLAADATDRESA